MADAYRKLKLPRGLFDLIELKEDGEYNVTQIEPKLCQLPSKSFKISPVHKLNHTNVIQRQNLIKKTFHSQLDYG